MGVGVGAGVGVAVGAGVGVGIGVGVGAGMGVGVGMAVAGGSLTGAGTGVGGAAGAGKIVAAAVGVSVTTGAVGMAVGSVVQAKPKAASNTATVPKTLAAKVPGQRLMPAAATLGFGCSINSQRRPFPIAPNPTPSFAGGQAELSWHRPIRLFANPRNNGNVII